LKAVASANATAFSLPSKLLSIESVYPAA